MACGCKKKKVATLSEPIKQPAQTNDTQINESAAVTQERDQQQIVDSILQKLKQINLD